MFGLVARRLLVRSSGVGKSLPIVRFSHGDPYDDESLTGFKRMFNNETIRGRANFAKLYLSMWAVGFAIYMIHKKRKAKAEKSTNKD